MLARRPCVRGTLDATGIYTQSAASSPETYSVCESVSPDLLRLALHDLRRQCRRCLPHQLVSDLTSCILLPSLHVVKVRTRQDLGLGRRSLASSARSSELELAVAETLRETRLTIDDTAEKTGRVCRIPTCSRRLKAVSARFERALHGRVFDLGNYASLRRIWLPGGKGS